MARPKPGPSEIAMETLQDLADGNWTAYFARHVKMLEVESYIPLAVEGVARLSAVLPKRSFDTYNRICDAVLLMALAVKAGATSDTAAFSGAVARVGTATFAQEGFAEDLREVMKSLSPRAYTIFNDALARGVPLNEAFLLAEEGRFPLLIK